MYVRLFPDPAYGHTPFAITNGVYQRYAYVDGEWTLVCLNVHHGSQPDFTSPCFEWNQRMPDRNRVREWLWSHDNGSARFREYVDSALVIPTFAMCAAEALTRVFMRQIVRAKQARRMFSAFVESYGYHHDGVVGFPAPDSFRQLDADVFRRLGLGFRSERLVRATASLPSFDMNLLEGLLGQPLPGIGPWSRSVLTVEAKRDYAYYPFDDQSGLVIADSTGMDLVAVAEQDRQLAADLYVYGASYVEARRH